MRVDLAGEREEGGGDSSEDPGPLARRPPAAPGRCDLDTIHKGLRLWSGFGVWGSGFRVSGFWFRVSGFWFLVSVFWFGVSSLGLQV